MLVSLFILTFLESVAATLIQRGLYFYTHESLGFDERHNLWVAFGFGIAYVAGARISHRAAERFGERHALVGCLAALAALNGGAALGRAPHWIVIAVLTSALVQGLKWPLLESYVSAGKPPKQLLSLLGRYNVTWAVAGFAAVGVTGVLVGTELPALFFSIPAALNLLGVALAWRLPIRPLHLADEHPERPPAGELARMNALLVSARWSMTGSYALLYVLAPLMPSLLAGLALPVTLATPVASILDGVRVIAFAVLGAVPAWHGRRGPLWFTLCAMPVGFLLILLAPSVAVLIVGEMLFGVAAGFAYTSSLYYALVCKNASVDAGGAHEGLIGIGLALGPLSGIAGQLLVGMHPRLPGQSGELSMFFALALTTIPIAALCSFGALRPLLKLPARHV